MRVIFIFLLMIGCNLVFAQTKVGIQTLLISQRSLDEKLSQGKPSLYKLNSDYYNISVFNELKLNTKYNGYLALEYFFGSFETIRYLSNQNDQIESNSSTFTQSIRVDMGADRIISIGNDLQVSMINTIFYEMELNNNIESENLLFDSLSAYIGKVKRVRKNPERMYIGLAFLPKISYQVYSSLFIETLVRFEYYYYVENGEWKITTSNYDKNNRLISINESTGYFDIQGIGSRFNFGFGISYEF